MRASPLIGRAGIGTVWNRGDAGAGVLFSNYDLTAASSNNRGVRATQGRAYGRWHFEVTADVVDYNGGTGTMRPRIGVATAAAALDATFTGAGAAFIEVDGDVIANASTVGTGSSYVSNGFVIAVEIDVAAQQIWFQRQGQARFGPFATGLTGPLFPYLGLSNSAQGTANFGRTPFVVTPTASFNPFG